jgi:hypothetical protein
MPQLSEYVQKRYRVLFEVWFPNVNLIVIRSNMCRACGFVTNHPRPDDADIDAKYRFLAELGQDYGQTEKAATVAQRSQSLYDSLRPFLPRRGTVLDFGGGDGRLMQSFAAQRHVCLLVDYNAAPRDCVRKLGDTLAQIPGDLRVDAIVCSHVMEHVADPVGDLQRLAKYLTPEGVMVVEVPMEIWGRAPLREEPVTHVNFFVPSTLRNALSAAGLGVITCRLLGSLHPSGRLVPAVRATARRAAVRQSLTCGTAEIRGYLNPGLVAKLQRRWMLGQLSWRSLQRRWASRRPRQH